jgi:hypothetical protein
LSASREELKAGSSNKCGFPGCSKGSRVPQRAYMTRRLFIAATKQNDGKTTVCLGLIQALKNNFDKIGFIKPIGQRYLEEDGLKVDEDSILIEKAADIECNLQDMSPVAVERGFTERYILKPQKEILTRRILDSFARVSRDKDVVVIEGTGHAGVGSCFEHSNAYVAGLLNAGVIIISSGGIGRPVDEIILNCALFEREHVKIIGVIINKVHPEKIAKVNKLVGKCLGGRGLRLLGAIPYVPVLSLPNIGQLLEETGYRLLSGEESVDNKVARILVGAMQPHDALNYLQSGSLVITPGDREDIILMCLSSHLACIKGQPRTQTDIAGIVLTGGILPHPRIMQIIKDAGLPVLLAEADTYSVASKIHDLTIKIRPSDQQKIETVVKLVRNYVDIEGILKEI